jgi:ketosteroid isomerase-like protein
MSIFQQLDAATKNRDAEAYVNLMADDCVFVRHQNGTEMHKPQMSEMLRKMMSSGGADMGNRRCVYENDDILVVHSVNDYPDGTREAVLAAYSLRDGKITRLETGATPLAK